MATHWKSGVVVAGLLLAAFLVNDYMGQRERLSKAEASQQASTVIVQQQQQVIQQATAAIKDRDQAAVAEQARWATLVASLRTPQQAVAALPQVVQLPVAPRALEAKDVTAGSSAKVGDYVVSKEDMVPLVQTLAACKEGASKLNACQADLKDTTSQFWAAQKQFDAAADSAKKWEQAARGGSRWQRAWRHMKPVACAAGGAAVGALAHRGNSALGAAVGAGAGGVACSLF